MQIKYHKRFEKQFKKLPSRQQLKVVAAIDKFVINPNDKILSNHKLNGRLKEMRAISAASDLRLIFEEFDNYFLVVFLDLGNHSHVYA